MPFQWDIFQYMTGYGYISDWFLRLLGTSANSKTFFINCGTIPVLTLNISVISFCIFRWCKVVVLSFLRTSWMNDSKSTTRKALSWCLLMQAFSLRLWNIQTTEWTIWKVTNYKRIHNMSPLLIINWWCKSKQSILWKKVRRTFRCIYVEWFNKLGFLAEENLKLQKKYFLTI